MNCPKIRRCNVRVLGQMVFPWEAHFCICNFESILWEKGSLSVIMCLQRYHKWNSPDIYGPLDVFEWDVASLRTVGSFLLTAERFLLAVVFGSFLLTIGVFLLTVRTCLLTVQLLCLQWEGVSKKHPNGL